MSMLAEDHRSQPFNPPLRIKDLFGRTEAAREMGIRYAEFKKREDEGVYVPTLLSDGKAYYSRSYLQTLPGYKGDKRFKKGLPSSEPYQPPPKRRPVGRPSAATPSSTPAGTTAYPYRPPMYKPEQAAAVFAEFRKGTEPEVIVGVVSVYPEHVKMLYREWIELKALGGGLILRKEVVEKINALNLPGVYPVKTDDELLENLKDMAGTTERALCMSCKKGPRQFCEACATAEDD